MPCSEPVELKRKDTGVIQIININVQRGSCPADAAACEAGFIQNIDFTSSIACTCEPLHPALGTLIDAGADTHPGYSFAFDKPAQFTLREWANAAGEYDWALQTIEELQAITCLTHSAAIDDGRYRQVTFEATTPDCVTTIVRKWLADDTVTQD
jgi:hypothetical protein